MAGPDWSHGDQSSAGFGFQAGQEENAALLARTLLDVPEGAPEGVVTAAYRRKIQRYHPDHGGDAAIARARIMARETLKRG
jgi:hypothetical protein